MQKNYQPTKVEKKKSAMGGVWLILILAAIFIFIIAKFALSGSDGEFNNGLPDNEDAYEVAQEFVKATVIGSTDFPTSGYQFAKQSDSVYIIKSYVETEVGGGTVKKTDFVITMRYKGGRKTNKSNWDVLDLNQNQN